MKNLQIYLFILLINICYPCWCQPSIYIYSDFGGGQNAKGQNVYDTQTAQELVSAAWKKFAVQNVYINDAAKPLSPKAAAFELAEKFPYKPPATNAACGLNKAVVHVIDPGVENDNNALDHHPRAAVLRKDGVLFVGPDNGTLSFACPPGSVAGIWQIDEKQLQNITGNDTSAGGTFHGRDVFLEYALLVATGKIVLGDCAHAYTKCDLKYRYSAITFDVLPTNFWSAHWALPENDNVLFEKAFLLGIMLSPWYDANTSSSRVKVFFVNTKDAQGWIAIVNKKTKNIYVGPNNGWGTAFFKDYSPEDVTTYTINQEQFERIWKQKDSQAVLRFIQEAPVASITLKEVDFKGGASSVSYDPQKRYATVQTHVWIDAYGNIKTTLRSDLFQKLCASKSTDISIQANGVKAPLIQETSFARVPQGRLFIYPGSSACIGDNPNRSVRYMEVSSNGVYGLFGADFFVNKKGQALESGQVATIRIALNA